MIRPVTALVDHIMQSRRRQYWALQFIGWGGYLGFLLLSAGLWEESDPVRAAYAVMAAITGISVSLVIHKSLQVSWEKPPVQRAVVTALAVGLGTAFWAALKFGISLQIYPDKSPHAGLPLFLDYLYWYSYSFFILLSWTGLYYGVRHYQMMQDEREKALKLTAAAHQAQLRMLRYQLNPHFLFNTLNAISTLILDARGDTANRMVTALSRFLRYSLDNDPMQKVTLQQEVEAMQLYLGIEKLRFEERLEVEVSVEERAREALIPSLLLQPLVENAIKYAVARSETGGTIRLKARVFAGELLLELSDDGPGHEAAGTLGTAASGGVGLRNTRERLRAIYGSDHQCRISNAEPHGLCISIRIPFESGTETAQWRN
jgi:signal transduction histidine kinase